MGFLCQYDGNCNGSSLCYNTNLQHNDYNFQVSICYVELKYSCDFVYIHLLNTPIIQLLQCHLLHTTRVARDNGY